MSSKIIWGAAAAIIILGGILWLWGSGGGSLYAPSGGGQTTQPTTPPVISPSEPGMMETVTLDQSGFSPKEVKIKVGTKVVWMNQSGAMAAVNSALHPTHLLYPPLNLGQFEDGASLELVFDQPGTYRYHNHLTPTQFGRVVVE